MKVIIFEDELHNAERLIQLLKQCTPGIEVLAVIESIAEGIKWFSIAGNHADLIFMDIQLSDGNCFELFDQVKIITPVVFATAYDSFALQAFQVYSVDYLLKPIDLKDLRRAMDKYAYFTAPTDPGSSIAKIAAAFFKREHTRFIGKLIIHIDAIKKITSYYNSRFILQLQPETDLEAVISRERAQGFKAWLEGKDSEV